MQRSIRFLAILTGLLSLSAAQAATEEEANKIIRSCTSDTTVPSSELLMGQHLPSGALRGSMSAQQATIEAWIALKAAEALSAQGNEAVASRLRNRAVEWLMVCLVRDQEAQSVVAHDSINSVLQKLGAWKPPFNT
jgi:hypothetical protein